MPPIPSPRLPWYPRALARALAALSWAALLAHAPPAWSAETAASESAEGQPERAANRSFRGFGFHSHLELGAMAGQHTIEVARYEASSLSSEASPAERELAAGIGAATRLELWPAYGRHVAIGVYGAGHLGGMRREGGLSGVLGGSTGLIATAGHPRAKLLLTLGRAWRGGAFSSEARVAWEMLELDAEVRAGAERVRAYRGGLGFRVGLNGANSRGLDLWLLFDEPTGARGESAPLVVLPRAADAALLVRGALWSRNAVALGVEWTARAAPLGQSEARGVRGRSGLVTLSWTMDRFSRPYAERRGRAAAG